MSGPVTTAGGLDTVSVQCIEDAQAGDVLAMSALLDALAPWVGRLCGSIALEHGADAAQETLIQVFRDLRTLRDPARLRGWVRRIATRESVRHAQRGRREPPLDPLPGVPDAGDPALAHDVRSVLQRLSPEQRAILVMRDLEGLSEAEAAALLQVARGTVKSRLHRARQAFIERWST